MKVKCLKLVTGEELICKHLESLDQSILTVEDIFSIGLQRVGPNEVAVGMSPWLVGNPGQQVSISLSHVLTSYLPAAELEKEYLTRTTGIQLV